jgi:prepilin-type N-terminal cleavage/methylation domain-containing protein
MKQKGFTLIELLVVISIIGLLASVVLVALNGARVKARDAKRISDKKQVITAMNLYIDGGTTGTFPSTGSAWYCLAPSSETCWRGSYAGNDALVTAMSPYLPVLPTNIADSGTYANNRLLYYAPYSYNGATGALLIWEQERQITASECYSPWAPQPYDKYWYCYEFLQ